MRDEKVRELNLTDNDMPDGYYIYNPNYDAYIYEF